MRALEFITDHVIYNPVYTYKFQLKTTHAPYWSHKTLLLITSTSTPHIGIEYWESLLNEKVLENFKKSLIH